MRRGRPAPAFPTRAPPVLALGSSAEECSRWAFLCVSECAREKKTPLCPCVCMRASIDCWKLSYALYTERAILRAWNGDTTHVHQHAM